VSRRRIVIERLVDARINRAKEVYPRLSEVWEALLWRLSRDAGCGMKQPVEGDWYALKTRPWKAGNVPSITLLYQLTSESITLRSSKLEEVDDEESGCD